MTSGGPGDHWRTDLLSWQKPAFGEPCDSLLLEIESLGGQQLLADDAALGRRVMRLWSQSRPADPGSLRTLAQDLREIRDWLRAEAIERGWEVP